MAAGKTIKYWLTGAKEAMVIARQLFAKKSYHYALFFGHLALEKMLKAVFVKVRKTHPPYTHALIKLAEGAGLKISQADMEFLALVNRFNLETRYPADITKLRREFTRDFARQNLTKIKNFHLWLGKKLKQLR